MLTINLIFQTTDIQVYTMAIRVLNIKKPMLFY